jgi:putative transposase
LTGRNPTDRVKRRGTKRHVLTDQNGIPLSVVITAANTHNMKNAVETLDNIVIVKRKARILASFFK